MRKSSLTSSNSFLRNVQIQMKQNKKLNELLEEAEETRGLIDVMIENIVIVKNIQSNVLAHTNQEIQKELETRTYSITQLAHRIYNKLRELGKDANIEDVTFNTAREGPAYKRIRVLQYTTMFKLYSETMHDYNENLLRYHDKCSSLLHQQRRLLRRQITSEELEDMLDSQETSLFVDNILAETKLAQQQLSDIETRHNELQKLEKSIVEVRDIFLEMAFLVERQGEQLNCVEYFASKATDDVDSGRDRLIKANEKRNKHRMRKMKIALIVCIIIIIIFLMIICS
ncbi:syntaxin-1A-like [Nasonia vitripennis]|uniref:t-SNARE coiled-coil homology domain-containing protein n=1 Tax=Nasonia vitripennis TaxID=7425 RepID=A0A7M7PZH8_NASVI|nr:syntaxin-1A-like [Nasonia vitripennis]